MFNLSQILSRFHFFNCIGNFSFKLPVFNFFYSFQERSLKFSLHFCSSISIILSRLTVLVFIPFSIKAASLSSSIFSVSIALALVPVFFARLSQNFASAL